MILQIDAPNGVVVLKINELYGCRKYDVPDTEYPYRIEVFGKHIHEVAYDDASERDKMFDEMSGWIEKYSP